MEGSRERVRQHWGGEAEIQDLHETSRPVIKAIPLNHVLNYVLMYSTNKWDLRGIKTIIIIFIIINIYMFQL